MSSWNVNGEFSREVEFVDHKTIDMVTGNHIPVLDSYMINAGVEYAELIIEFNARGSSFPGSYWEPPDWDEERTPLSAYLKYPDSCQNICNLTESDLDKLCDDPDNSPYYDEIYEVELEYDDSGWEPPDDPEYYAERDK